MPRLLLCIICFLFINTTSSAQQLKQSIRGTVYDKDANYPLIGVNVAIMLNEKILASGVSDNEGNFRIENIDIGRVNLNATYIGYNKVFIPNILVTSAKEVVIRIDMESSLTEMKEVVVSGGKRKGETINEMTTLSAREFSVDEAARYAGSRNDPARMASNFAGVSGTDDSRNDIVIRGNSPFGVLWRLENVHIPNPSHFAVAGTTGGPVGMLSNRVLANSDFMTGAFPAEYGNALAGVFDVRFKNGNNEKHEFGFQFGLMGAELFAEGPLSKKNKSSYVFNYRYATLELLVQAGIDIGTKAIPQYQDLQFKFNFPMKKGGNISVFGIGGYSTVNLITSKDLLPNKREIYSSKDVDEYFRSGMGVIGMSYTRPLNERAYSKITFAASTQYLRNHFIRIQRHIDTTLGIYIIDDKYDKMFYRFMETKVSGNFFRNYKLNTKHTIKFGMNTEAYIYSYSDSILNETNFNWERRLSYKGVHFLLQPYVQWRWKPAEKITLNAGLHGQLFTLNNSWAIEPRIAAKYQFTRRNQIVSLGFGLHSQMQPSYIYFHNLDFSNISMGVKNKNLDFSRSFQSVAGYDIFFKHDIRLRAEAYFQYLFAIPVDQFVSSYSVINEGSSFDRFFPGQLVNNGVGRNMGIELTVEKFFTNNWFIMFSGSLFDSKYKASDNIWYNTSFNSNYIMKLFKLFSIRLQ